MSALADPVIRMLRHLVIAIVALVGYPTWGRPSLCVGIAAVLLAISYWLALPTELPTWPIYVTLGVAAGIGFIWDHRSNS